MQKYRITITLFLLLITAALNANTSLIVSAGASADKSVIVSYSYDSNDRGGFMYYSPRQDKAEGTVETIHSNWNGNKKKARIDTSGQNYNVTGHMNEHNLVIGDSSFTPLLADAVNSFESSVDTGILIEMTLKKASTAREAIAYIDKLTKEMGFYGPGKSFSIADKEEAWIMEMISKGSRGQGTLWVARRIPEGYVSGHADSSRITTFPLDDRENCLYSPDVITFARENGLWDGSDEKFSFADVYTEMVSMDIRQTEGRLWNIYRKVNKDIIEWKDYILGDIKREYPARGTANGIISNRLPLWVKADKPLTVEDVIELMRDHYENTELSMATGIWSGPFGNPYRLRPDNAVAREYFYNHDRPVSVQYTGYSFVSQSRPGISWFGVDDTYMTVYLPVFSTAGGVPSCFSRENNPVVQYSDKSAYWLFNGVSNFTALRYNEMIKDISIVQQNLERDFRNRISTVKDLNSDELTEISEEMGNHMMEQWRKLFHYLLIKYKDGEVRTEQNGKFVTEPIGHRMAIQIYGYPANWAQAMIGKDNPPDLKALYSDDELMELFARNNRNSILVIVLLAIIAVLASALMVNLIGGKWKSRS